MHSGVPEVPSTRKYRFRTWPNVPHGHPDDHTSRKQTTVPTSLNFSITHPYSSFPGFLLPTPGPPIRHLLHASGENNPDELYDFDDGIGQRKGSVYLTMLAVYLRQCFQGGAAVEKLPERKSPGGSLCLLYLVQCCLRCQNVLSLVRVDAIRCTYDILVRHMWQHDWFSPYYFF